MVIFNENKWLKIGVAIIAIVLCAGILKVIMPGLLLKKVEGKVVVIEQKYSAEGDEKLITLSLEQQPIYRHKYVNKDYLPSPQLTTLKDYKHLVTYVSKEENSNGFYGLELSDGTVIQSKRWDIISDYLNRSLVIFILVAVPIALYCIYGKKLLIAKQNVIILVIYSLALAFIWGRLHIFLMVVLVLGLIRLGKNLSGQKKEQVTSENVDIPAQS